MKSILDPSFRYTSSVHTDLKLTFARIRRERKEEEERRAANVSHYSEFEKRRLALHANDPRT